MLSAFTSEIRVHTTDGPGCIKVKACNQLGISNSPPNLAPVDDAQIWVKANVKEKSITLELVMLIKRPHFIWANSYKSLPLKPFIPPCVNSIWLGLSEILRNNSSI